MMCRCSGFMELSSPQSVKDEMEIDVFDEIWTLTGSSSVYGTDYKKALWHAFRYRKIANCDLEYWEQCFADKMNLLLPKYDAFMMKWASEDVTDLSESKVISDYDRTPIQGTEGDVTRTETETFPITPVDDTKRYLTNANTQKYAPNTHEHSEETGYSDLASTTFTKMMADYNSPLSRFVDEFSDYFVNRWC